MDLLARLRTTPMDAALTAAFVVAGLAQLVVRPFASVPVGLVYVLGSTAPLLWRRTHPVAAALASSLFWLVPLEGYPLLGFVVVLLQFFALGRWGAPGRSVVLVAALATVLSVVGTLLGPEPPVAAIGGALVVVAPVVAGRLVRHQRLQNDALVQITHELAEERARAEDSARGLERARIAHEMHDVLGHEITLIAVQAEAAAAALRVDARRASEPVEAIRLTAHRMLHEMRSLLGVLGRDDSLDPGPEEDLAAVAERARRAGIANELRITGVPLPPSSPVSLAVTRIVQECLTNAGRHAAGGPLTVTVGWEPDEVAVVASNPTSGARRPREGRGLAGIRHRAELFGGTCRVGSDDGRFTVEVTIPVVRS